MILKGLTEGYFGQMRFLRVPVSDSKRVDFSVEACTRVPFSEYLAIVEFF